MNECWTNSTFLSKYWQDWEENIRLMIMEFNHFQSSNSRLEETLTEFWWWNSCLIGQQLLRKHSTIPKFHQPHMLNSSLHVTTYISLSRGDYGFYFPPTSPAQKLLLWGRTELWMRSQGLFIHNYFNDVVW